MMNFVYQNLEKVILAGLLLLASLCYWLGYIFPSLSGLLINVSAGCISSVLTIGGIEFLRTKRGQQRSAQITESAEEDIRRIANMFVSYIASPLGFSVLHYERQDDEDSDSFGERTIHLVLQDVERKDLIRAMRSMSVKDWRGFAFNVQWLRQSLSETIQTYSGVMPPEVYGALLRVRIQFKDITNNFAVFHDYFVKPESEWLPNTFGEDRSRRNRELALRTFNDCFRGYFDAVQTLFETVDSIYGKQN